MRSSSNRQQQQQLEEHQRMARERLEAQLRSQQRQRSAPPQYYSHIASSLPRSSGHRSSNEQRQGPLVPVVAREVSSSSSRGITRSSSSYNARGIPSNNNSSSNEQELQRSSSRASSSSAATAAAGPTATSAQERLEQYRATKGKTKSHVKSEVVDTEDATLVQCLAVQAYHLPGYTWKQDWWQYMLNNHPVLGICCHHPRHPIKSCTRVVALIGSVVVGLAITNMFYLFFLWNPQFNQPLVSVVVVDDDQTGNNNSNSIASDDNDVTLTTGMLLLWTVGGTIHTTYNLFQWYIAACACCRPGGMCETRACCPSLGKHLLRVLVAIIISMAVLIILMRVAITNSEVEASSSELSWSKNNSTITTTYNGTATGNATTTGGDGSNNAGIHFFDDDAIELEVHDVSEFEFLVGYLVEMLLAFFVYYPIGGTLLFSGVLGCGGKIPILGGRPFEIKAEERRLARRERKNKNGASSRNNSSNININTDAEDTWSEGEDDEIEVIQRMDGGGGSGEVVVEHYRPSRGRGY